jgi:isopentenyl diphosphate isomerase/L-lactate dehydrogenase-like FMN-dependent dehydrogenase
VVARKLVERAERAGYQAIILTVDMGEWKDADRRNRFALDTTRRNKSLHLSC